VIVAAGGRILSPCRWVLRGRSGSWAGDAPKFDGGKEGVAGRIVGGVAGPFSLFPDLSGCVLQYHFPTLPRRFVFFLSDEDGHP